MNTPTNFADHQLRQITSLLEQVAGQLHSLASGASTDSTAVATQARIAYRSRRARDRVFSGLPGLFSDPAWDVLLDLFASRDEGVAVSVTSACIAACVPPTTGLRWIGTLERRGLITRQDDPRDARRAFLALTDQGADLVARALVRG